MTEREKMQNRKLYDANDRALCADRVRAKELCHAYNQLCPSDEAGKREILRRLLAKTGEDFCVTAPFCATMATTSGSESTFTPTITLSFWTVPR